MGVIYEEITECLKAQGNHKLRLVTSVHEAKLEYILLFPYNAAQKLCLHVNVQLPNLPITNTEAQE